jgi:hypothetical protein
MWINLLILVFILFEIDFLINLNKKTRILIFFDKLGKHEKYVIKNKLRKRRLNFNKSVMTLIKINSLNSLIYTITVLFLLFEYFKVVEITWLLTGSATFIILRSIICKLKIAKYIILIETLYNILIFSYILYKNMNMSELFC